MLDWLRRRPDEPLLVAVGGRDLPLLIRRLAQARRMTLRLAADGEAVLISMPRWAREADALAFVHSRADWLAEQAAHRPTAAPPEPGGLLPYRGVPHRIVHHPQGGRRIQCETETEPSLTLGGPIESVPGRLQRWLAAEARRLLAEDLADYCARAGLAQPALALTSARRRWGSCSASGTVRINWRLIMAPDAVRRSVVAHEVAHLIHFDHSPRFHALLADLFEGDIAEANRWLKQHGQALYGAFG